jgi:phage terminase large subunit-like protein
MSQKRIVIRGNTYENVLNLGDGYIEEIERDYGGTRQGEEELFAKMFDDAEGATAKQEHIKRRPRPDRFARTAISIDPAITVRAGSDTTGIVVGGLCLDGQGLVLADLSGRHRSSEWAKLVLEAYAEYRCDCVVVETNKGGDLVADILRAYADKSKIAIIVLGKTEKTPQHKPGVVYIREVYARGEKADRAKPVGTAYEKGRIAHVEGKTFPELEDLLTTWIPTPGRKSPDRLDALVHLMVELLGLRADTIDPKKSFQGIVAVAEAITKPLAASKRSQNLATLLPYGNDGSRI